MNNGIGLHVARGAATVLILIAAMIFGFVSAADAACPNMRVEQVAFSKSANVLIDHLSGYSHAEAEKKEKLEKALAINEYQAEPGEALNSFAWISRKAGAVIKNWPIAYAGGESIELKARFELEGQTGKLLEENLEKGVTITGETTVGLTAVTFKAEIPEATAKAQAKGNYLETGNMVASAALPKEVFHQLIGIKWKWKYTEKGGKVVEGKAGETEHNLYLTYKSTAGANVYYTFLAEDTHQIESVSKEPNEEGAIAGIWKAFSGASGPPGIYYWIYTPTGTTGGMQQSVEPLWYYKQIPPGKTLEELPASSCTAGTLELLLEKLEGTCKAWAIAFGSALESEGITWTQVPLGVNAAEVTQCQPDAWLCSILVKNWTFGPGTARTEFLYDPGEITDANGIPGQGVENPYSYFHSHTIVKAGSGATTAVYDPSYGTGPYKGTANGGKGTAEAVLKEVQEESIKGFCVPSKKAVEEFEKKSASEQEADENEEKELPGPVNCEETKVGLLWIKSAGFTFP